MDNACIDITQFCQKHHRIPEKDRVALWTFNIDGHEICFWGTLAEVFSTAYLYARMHDVDAPAFSLVDYSPMPKVFTAYNFGN